MTATFHTYRLGSSAMVGAPGLVAWAINGAHFKRDRKNMIKIIAETWHIPPKAAAAVVMQEVPYTVEDGTVVFTCTSA